MSEWVASPEDGKVATSLPVMGSDDVIVLLDPDVRPDGVEKWYPFPNIMRLNPSGHVIWRSELLPDDTWKCYLSVAWEGATLVARAASYRVTLDPTSGAVDGAIFTK